MVYIYIYAEPCLRNPLMILIICYIIEVTTSPHLNKMCVSLLDHTHPSLIH